MTGGGYEEKLTLIVEIRTFEIFLKTKELIEKNYQPSS